MTKYQKYAEYRNTESQWIDQIPSHWSMSALKHVLATPMTDGPHETPVFVDEGIPFVSAEAVSSGKIDFNKIRGFITVEDDRRFSQKYKPKLHDVYMIKSGATTGVTAIVETDQNFNIWSPLAAMRCKESFEPYYLLNYLRSDPFQKSVQLSWTFGTQQNIGMSTLENLPVCIPPLMEQRKISSFLTYETAKIDTLIAKQEKLIELLKEKRQAVISHAVTKGLNPDVTMKDSGVEWLGQVPEHWAVAKLAYRYEVLLGKMLDESKITGNYLGKYLRNTDVQWGRVNSENLPEMDFRPHEIERYSVQQGDLLVCEGGEIGRCAIWESEDTCFYQKALHRLRAYSSQDSHKFMFYVLFDSVHRERFISGAGKATIAHLPAETFKQYRFAFPPKNEQVQIVEYLDTMSKAFDEIETKALAQIKLLQERRTALISSAVTGKINVSNWQHPNEAKTELSL